jgi:hypothetical protein
LEILIFYTNRKLQFGVKPLLGPTLKENQLKNPKEKKPPKKVETKRKRKLNL